MKFQSKSVIILFSIVYYWFYLSICFGYEINQTDLSKSIQFRKKFSLKNIIKIIIDFFWKFIKNWFNTVEPFSKLSLRTLEQIHPRPSKLILKEPDQRPQIPFPILGDPFIWINVNLSWEESKNYNFELFEFYKNVNEKVKPPLK